MRIREPWPSARTRQRQREFAAVFDGVPGQSLGDGLEIGGGDGFLASLVAPHCRSFVTTDSYRPRLAQGQDVQVGSFRRLVCDATVLPFANASFDFIFSSSLLEHIRDRGAAYREMGRCLRPGGVMLHVMPSRTWKLLQMLLYYPHLLVGGIDLLLERLTRKVPPPRALPSVSVSAALVDHRWSDKRGWRLSLRTVAHGIVPRPHGEYPGHLAEWRGFHARAWEREFQDAGFKVHRILLLPLYSGYGFGLEWLRRLGERWGLSSHNGFVVSDAAAEPTALTWFDRAPRSQAPAALTPS
jgi:SAM-dependent methyltransferase